MRTPTFVITVLLIAMLATTTSKTVQEAKKNVPLRLLHDFHTQKPMDSTNQKGINTDWFRVSRNSGANDKFMMKKHLDTVFCNKKKKKVICSKARDTASVQTSQIADKSSISLKKLGPNY
ncbi:hypothetical protein HPP92_003097 [Vanilla planifolia]|uniref:Uncharacterized protein n=1 Tax=Vanilla planifolia TaxID=51239 RepID=A0A835S9Q5_VANPL|nr:hypothetical protein HPP92_003097 [Vanilla planifolia]